MNHTPTRTDPGAENRILLVEGHPDNREFLVLFLGMAGYAVTSCDSIPQAAKIVRDRHFDIYVVGDCLPHGSNLPLAAEIKTVNPNAPLVLYSALAFDSDIERGLEAGARAYITKPGNLDTLLATINGPLTDGGPKQADPEGTPGRRPSRLASGQPLRAIQPACQDIPDPRVSNRVARRPRSGAASRPMTRPRRARGRALGTG
jgi:DNA-binding response OmpR family regulator